MPTHNQPNQHKQEVANQKLSRVMNHDFAISGKKIGLWEGIRIIADLVREV